jgi:hypothetical protein
VASLANSGLDCQNGHIDLDNTERSRLSATNNEENNSNKCKQLEDLKEVYWSDGFYDSHLCAVCGHTKLTCWQGTTFKDELLFVCEDCKAEWEKLQEVH